MTENNVNTARRADWIGRIGRYSPFAFNTLKEFPWPNWAALISLVCFFFLCSLYSRNPNVLYLIDEYGDVVTTLKNANKGKKSQILIAGSSFNGIGMNRSQLENRLNQPVGKITFTVGTHWEALNVLKKYPKQFEDVRVLILVTSPDNFQKKPVTSWHSKTRRDRFLFFKRFGEFKVPGNELQVTWQEAITPLRIPLKTIKTIWKRDPDGTMENAQKIPPWLHAKMKDDEKNQRQNPEKTSKLKLFFNTWADSDMVDKYHELMDYCEKKGIHVILNGVPVAFMPDGVRNPVWLPNTQAPTSLVDYNNFRIRRYISLLDEVRFRNGSLILVDDMDAIIPNCQEQFSYFRDPHHLNEKGAKVYTDWFADQMLNSPKIAEALKKPRKLEEFIVKRGIRKTWRLFAGYFKKTAPDNKAIQVAVPQGATIR